MLKVLTDTYYSIFGRPNYTSRYTIEDYFKQFHVPKTLVEINQILTYTGDLQAVSQVAIAFKQVGFGENIKNVIKRLGKPMHRIDNDKLISEHEIIFYKYDLGGFKFIAQLHFLNERFFLGQYYFNEFKTAKFESIKNLIAQKYLRQPETGIGNIVITDGRNNKISIHNDTFGVINYISGEAAIYEELQQRLEAQQRQAEFEQNQKMKSLLENL